MSSSSAAVSTTVKALANACREWNMMILDYGGFDGEGTSGSGTYRETVRPLRDVVAGRGASGASSTASGVAMVRTHGGASTSWAGTGVSGSRDGSSKVNPAVGGVASGSPAGSAGTSSAVASSTGSAVASSAGAAAASSSNAELRSSTAASRVDQPLWNMVAKAAMRVGTMKKVSWSTKIGSRAMSPGLRMKCGIWRRPML